MANSVIILESQPGIQRDGTLYDRKNYIDGQWVRFYRNRPMKIGGYRLIDQGNTELMRTIYNYDNPNKPDTPKTIDTYIGRNSTVSYITFDLNGFSGAGEVNRTPVGYIPDPGGNNLWDFDIFTDREAPDSPLIVAHVAPNADDVSNNDNGGVYFGKTDLVSGNSPLKQIVTTPNALKISGGIVFAPPILIVYGNSGFIRWSVPGSINDNMNPNDNSAWPADNTQSIANTKIIKMVLTRGSATPQLLAWTLGSLLSLTYSPDPADLTKTIFTTVTVDNQITVMSPSSIIGYANQFFWIGLNQFYFFNGIVQKLPNTMSSQFFFDNVNLAQRSKIWAEIVNPGTGTEIWWHWPKGLLATECNHTTIYNVDAKIWYDTAISRVAGASANVFPLPMMADSSPTNIVTRSGTIQVYPLWMHEIGFDQILIPPPSIPTLANIVAIQSYFETHIYDFFEGNPGNNRAMRSRRIEPDFLISGNMTLTVNNRFFPNGQIIQGGPYTFNLNTDKIDAVSSQGRLASYRFESNEIGGSYQMGKTLLNYNIGDSRPSGDGASGTGS